MGLPRYAVFIVSFGVLLAACGQGLPKDTTAPTVAVTAPSFDSVLTVGASVAITGTAVDPSGVASVEVLIDGEAIETVVPSSTGAWSVNWTPAGEGNFVISATAADNIGNAATSAGVAVQVVLPIN